MSNQLEFVSLEDRMENLIEETRLKEEAKAKAKKQQDKKTKQLRLLKRVNVLDPASCTLNEKWINRPQSTDRIETIKKIFEELS